MAQEVQTIAPEAVVRGRDGYLEVRYDKLGLKFQSYERWIASGARIPTIPGSGPDCLDERTADHIGGDRNARKNVNVPCRND